MQRLNLTDSIINKLGFSEYWDENGTGGTRTLNFSTGDQFRIYEQDEMEDGSEGYGDHIYIANHYYFCNTFAIPRRRRHYHKDLFFLHNIYECIEKFYPNSLSEFTTKCEELGMAPYIKSFLDYRAVIAATPQH